MTILSVDDRLVTNAVLDYLENTADLSTNESGNVDVILIGDHAAPTPDDDQDLLTEIEIASETMRPYLVVHQVPGAAFDREARGGYAGGTPSTRRIRWQLIGVALQMDAAQQLAVYAAARLCDPPYPLTSTTDHEMSVWERIPMGFGDREGKLMQWSEFVEADVARAL